jgi:polar amino acid transport system substrate-binding protein
VRPAGSTSLDKLKTFPDVKVVTAATHTGSLGKFQQGQADAITGDDTVLAGLAAQDPYASCGANTVVDRKHRSIRRQLRTHQ